MIKLMQKLMTHAELDESLVFFDVGAGLHFSAVIASIMSGCKSFSIEIDLMRSYLAPTIL